MIVFRFIANLVKKLIKFVNMWGTRYKDHLQTYKHTSNLRNWFKDKKNMDTFLYYKKYNHNF